jgi:hypothetical protein
VILVYSILGATLLPFPPQSIELCAMKEEHRVCQWHVSNVNASVMSDKMNVPLGAVKALKSPPMPVGIVS